MKNKRLLITVVYFLILLAVPGYIIHNYYTVLSTGEAYKIEVGAYDPYDPFRGRYVAIRPLLSELRWGAENIQLIKNTDGFVVGVWENGDRTAAGYVDKFVLERYYLNEKTAPIVEERQRRAIEESDLMYVVIRVKNGGFVIEGLYINGVAAEDYVK